MTRDDLDSLSSEVERKFGKPDDTGIAVVVTCPECGKSGVIVVDAGAFAERGDGTCNYPVEGGIVCDHAFMAYIDAHFKAR